MTRIMGWSAMKLAKWLDEETHRSAHVAQCPQFPFGPWFTKVISIGTLFSRAAATAFGTWLVHWFTYTAPELLTAGYFAPNDENATRRLATPTKIRFLIRLILS